MLGAVLVGHAGEDSQEVAQAVTPVAILPESDPGQIEGPAGDGADIVVEHEPLEPYRLEFFQVLGKMLGHPAAVDPQEQIDPLVNPGRANRGLVVGSVSRKTLAHLLVGQQGGIVQDVVVQGVVAHGDQVHPVASLRRLQQPTLVHVLEFQPND